MALPKTVLGDYDLIQFWHEHSDELRILSDVTKDRLNSLWTAIKPASDAAARTGILLAYHKDVRHLWYNLLIDAVHALKVRDAREKAANKFDDANPPKRTNARKKSAHGINELWKYFDAFESFEGVLYGSEPLYRDHVVHVLRVWLVGVRILLAEGIGKLDVGMRPLGSHEERKLGEPPTSSDIGVWNEELWGIWTLVALCHDLGYPLEKTHKVNSAVDAMLRHFGQISTSKYLYSFQEQHHALTHETLKLVSSKVCAVDGGGCNYTTQVQEKYHTKFARSLASLSHGIVSCLVLLQTLIYFMETDYDSAGRGELQQEDARQFQIRREILRAIASHTCTEIYHLKVNTPSFLLILCDELQEWGRPTFGDMKLGKRPSDGECDNVSLDSIDLTAGRVHVSMTFRKGTVDEKRVESKFREFCKLLRPAPADEQRKIDFVLHVSDGDADYKLRYDSNAEPFDELTITKGGGAFDVYPDPKQ